MKGNEKMEEKRKNQRERVLDYLNKGGVLTDYNGYPIKKGWIKSKNQYGTSRIMTYYIEGE